MKKLFIFLIMISLNWNIKCLSDTTNEISDFDAKLNAALDARDKRNIELGVQVGLLAEWLIREKKSDWLEGKTVGELRTAVLNFVKYFDSGMSEDASLDKACPNPVSNIVTSIGIVPIVPHASTNSSFTIYSNSISCFTNQTAHISGTNWIGVPITGDKHEFSIIGISRGWHPEYELGLSTNGTVVWRNATP